jgi:hypothetical protein
MVEEVKAAGIEPILIIPPSGDPRENFSGLPEGVQVWRYNHPSRYPELYEASRRYDDTHLNHEGAILFTDLLAARFAEHSKAADNH